MLSLSDQVLGGLDDFYVTNAELDMLYVPFDESGHPIEERCGRHLQGIYEYISAYNNANPDDAIIYSGVPGYTELFLEADSADLGGDHLGSFLK